MSDVAFTGERLHEGSDLFGVDLVRHRVAYEYALDRARPDARVIDVGSGSGYGVAELSAKLGFVVGLDRIAPDRAFRAGHRFVRGDLRAVPIREQRFELVTSFQVIEHLEDPTDYLEAIARLMHPHGEALITTPNILQSDRENPFHVHEYGAEELRSRLGRRFANVELLGIGATPEVARYYDERLARIRRITRIDPLGLRRRIPRSLIEWLFGRFALVVRRGIQKDQGLPQASSKDFPIGPPDEASLDLLAICRNPR